MAHYGHHPRLTRDTPPPNVAVWHWFVCNGPHGEGFQWVDPILGAGGELRLLRRFILEWAEAIPDFERHARTIAVESLGSDDVALVLKGIHVLTAIGTDEEMLLVKPFSEDLRSVVAKHARTALFERGIKKKR